MSPLVWGPGLDTEGAGFLVPGVGLGLGLVGVFPAVLGRVSGLVVGVLVLVVGCTLAVMSLGCDSLLILSCLALLLVLSALAAVLSTVAGLAVLAMGAEPGLAVLAVLGLGLAAAEVGL